MNSTSLQFNDTDTTEALLETVRLRLFGLSYYAFALACRRILLAHGYTNLTLSSRLYRKGRVSSGSGVDMRGFFETPTGRVAVIISLKGYRLPVPAFFVNQLRGVLLPNNASQGLILSTSTFSPKAREAANSFPGRPIPLIGGRQLAQMALQAGVGVAEELDLRTGKRRRIFSERQFDELDSFARQEVARISLARKWKGWQ